MLTLGKESLRIMMTSSVKMKSEVKNTILLRRAGAALALMLMLLPAMRMPARAAESGQEPAILRAGDLAVSGASFARWYAIVRGMASGDGIDAKVEEYLARSRASLLLARAAADAGLDADPKVIRRLKSYYFRHLHDFYMHKVVDAAAREYARAAAEGAEGKGEERFYRQEKQRLAVELRDMTLEGFSFEVDQDALEAALWTGKEETVVARAGDYEVFFGDLVPQLQQVSHPSSKMATKMSVAKVVLKSIRTRLIVATLAEREGYGKDPEFFNDMQEQRVKVLSQAWLDEKVFPQVKVSREEMEAYYGKNRESYRRGREKEVFEIQVGTMKEAERILALVREGGDFSGFVREYSRGPTRDLDGALGFLMEGEIILELDSVIKTLEAEEISEVVQSPHGFHILYCKSVPEGRIPPLEELAPGIRAKLTEEAREKSLSDTVAALGKTTHLVFDEALLKKIRGEK